MPTHDPRQVVESLRSHLATHEKHISFLFGAGASCAVPTKVAAGGKATPLIPAVADLTRHCGEAVSAISKEHACAWDALNGECKTATGSPNIEVLLSRLRMKLDAMSASDKMLGFDRESLRGIESAITKTIAGIVQPAEALIPEKLPHHDLARWISNTLRRFPVEIFTTNYDILIERALEDERVPTFDGFVGSHRAFFLPDSLHRADSSPGQTWTRVWKIHGSINWQWADIAGQRRIIRGQPVTTGEMILPSHYKYDESRKQPYVALLDRLRTVLGQEDALLLCLGYSFSDEHINSVIFDALSARPRVHVYGLQFHEPEDGSLLVKAASTLKNLVLLGPNSAVIGAQRGSWRLSEPLDDHTADQLSKAFEASKAKDGDPDYLSGRLKLGDFAVFCEFLRSLSEK